MKKISKYFVMLFLIGMCFLDIKVSASTMNVMTKTSDKLLGNFIESAYNIFYGRESDLDGFTYWYEMLGTGQVSAKYFVEKFVLESKEFMESTKLKEDFVDKIYQFILGRKPEKDGRQYWLDYIDGRILYVYKNQYPSNVKNSDILTLRWNINDSPNVLYEVVNKMMESPEFSIRVSLMNIKLDKNNVNLPVKRTDALAIFEEVDRDIYIVDNSEKIKKAQEKAAALEEKIYMNSEVQVLKNKIVKYLGNNINNVAVSFYDFNTKQGFDINGDVLFKAGSTHKLPLNLVLYDLVQAGKINLNSKVEYVHSKHYEGGSGVFQNQVVNQYLPPQTFRELSRRSLLNSDNIAANMLITGINQYANLYNEYGKILGYPLNRTGNMFSTNEMNTFFKKLYYNKDNNPNYQFIIDNLKNSAAGVRIGRYIPESIVADKYGSYQGNYHDVGLVFGDRPFAISIYTKDLPNAERVIANIAKMAYER